MDEILCVGGAKIFPRDNIFPRCCALQENIIPWENINSLAVHRNMICHDRSSEYLHNMCNTDAV